MRIAIPAYCQDNIADAFEIEATESERWIDARHSRPLNALNPMLAELMPVEAKRMCLNEKRHPSTPSAIGERDYVMRCVPIG